jgi:protein gp37
MSATTKIQWSNSTWTPVRATVKSNAAEIAKEKGYTSLIQIAGKMAGRAGPHCEHISPGCRICYAETLNGRCLPGHGTGLPFDRRSRDLVDIELDQKILAWPLHWQKPRMIFVCSQTDLFADFVPDAMIDRVFDVMAACPQHVFQSLTKRPTRMVEYMSLRKPTTNVWCGVSAENQEQADERIPLLLQTPASVRFVSYEPALELVDFRSWLPGLDWIIIGGESGQRRQRPQPFHLEWAKFVIAQCHAAGVAAFFKQAGSCPVFDGLPLKLRDAKGGDVSELPEFCRVREFPRGFADLGGTR